MSFFFNFLTPNPYPCFFFFFLFHISWRSDRSLLLFLLEASELVLDGERRLLRLRRLQVDVDLLLRLLRFRRRGLLWRDGGGGGGVRKR